MIREQPMVQAAVNDVQYRGINRTVCIGLGGTGRDVLMRIRRLVVDRHNDLSNLPIVSFVHIDTDKAATQISGIRSGSNYRGVDLSFREAEKVSATMSTNEVTMFVEGLSRRSEYTRHGPYDHIGRWFPPQLLRNIKAVEEGAKGIRPVGRLAFFHNYQKVRTAIETAERLTRDHNPLMLKQGLRVDPGLNIFVVGSLCGGTGSGMFLDVAYALRHLYGSESVQIVGYFVVSPELYGNTPSMGANTYAALKELNYYSTPGTKFEACYDIDNLAIVQEQRPPFDYTYLVSSQTKGEYQILSQGKLCNVIASKIALDFSGELAPTVKGQRDNFLQHLIQWDKHPRPNGQRYLTFGLAAIYFPRDIIIQIALTWINLDLTKFWLNGKGQSPEPQRLLEEFLTRNSWQNDRAKSYEIASKLSESIEESNKIFTKTITDWKNKLEQVISLCQNREERNSLRGQLPREFREQFRKVQPGETENIRGIWLTKLQQNRPKLTQQLIAHIYEFLARLLTPSEPNFSIKNTRNWLDALQYDLRKYQSSLQEQISEYSGMKRLEDIEKQWRDAEEIIQEIEDKPSIPFVNNKNHQLQDEARKALRTATESIKQNFELTVLQEVAKIVDDLQQILQEISTKVAAFNNLVENLMRAYEKQESDLKQLNFDEMSGEAIFENEDIARCYEVMLPEDDVKSQLVLASSAIIEPTGQEKSLVCFIDERISLQQLKKDIDIKVDSLFAPKSINIVNSVIKRFMQKYSAGARSTRLAQIMQEAEPLLRLNLTDPYYRDDLAKSSKLIGFKDIDESEVQQFKTLLDKDLGIPASVLKPTQAGDEILIVNEYAGFPLRLVGSLEKMRNPYLREQNSATSFLHNDYGASFPDIIPPDAMQMEKLEDIFYPCLALGLLSDSQDSNKLEFQFYDTLRDSYHIAALSKEWNQALEELANRSDMTQALEKLLHEEIAVIEKQPELWQNEYPLKFRAFIKQVDDLAQDSPNYPFKSTVIGSNDATAKEGIIPRFRRKIETRLKTSQPVISDSKNNYGQVLLPEIVNDSVQDSTYTTSTIDNRAKRRQELELLQKDLADGIITQDEYESERQKILKAYPLT